MCRAFKIGNVDVGTLHARLAVVLAKAGNVPAL